MTRSNVVEPELTLNRFSEVVRLRNLKGEALVVIACRRGFTLSCGVIEREREPVLYEALRRFVTRISDDAELGVPPTGKAHPMRRWRTPPALLPRLKELGLLLPKNEVPRRVPFTPRGSERTLRALRHESTRPSVQGQLLVHPGLRIREAGKLPRAVEAALTRLELSSSSAAVLRDPGTGAYLPISAAGALDGVVRSLVPGRPAPELDRRVERALIAQGVLLDAAALKERKRLWDSLSSTSARALREERYAIIRNLLPPSQVEALRQYYGRLADEGFMAFRCVGDQRAFIARDEAVAAYFQGQLSPLMSRIVGRKIDPSWLVVTAYQPGATCPRHVDQPDSHWNISLQIDFSPEPVGPAPWPLYLETGVTDGEPRPVLLGLGDAVIYPGNRLPHFRERLSDAQRSLVLVFHYRERDRPSS